MKRVITLLFAASLLASAGSIKTVQTTIGGSTTQVITTNTFCRQIFFENNATHSMRIGDSTTTSSKGIVLASGSPGGSWTVTSPYPGQALDLSDWYVAGTASDVLDVACTQ